MTEQGEVYADFVAGELAHERKRREVLDGRASGMITTSAAVVALAVAVGIFDPGSLSDQPAVLRVGFTAGATSVMISAVLAVWAGWLHGYEVQDDDTLRRIVNDPDWGDAPVDARGKVAQFNTTTLTTLRSGNNRKSAKLLFAHVFQLAGLVLLLTVAVATVLRSSV